MQPENTGFFITASTKDLQKLDHMMRKDLLSVKKNSTGATIDFLSVQDVTDPH